METKTSSKLLQEFLTKAAIETAREQCPDKTFDEKTVQDIRDNAKSAVEEISQILHKIRNEGKKGAEAVVHLTPERITKMKTALDIKTYEVKINEKEKKAQFLRNGNEMYPAIPLDTAGHLNQASDLEIASIVVESIILILEIIGVGVPDDEEDVKKAIGIAVQALSKDSDLLQDVDKIKNDMNNYPAMAKDIFLLVIDTVNDGVFWAVVKALLSNMPWYDWVLTSAKIAAFIVTLIATDGLAEIAELVAILADASFFMEKLANLGTFKRMMLSFTSS